VVSDLTQTASEAGTTQLKNYPSFFKNYTNSIFGTDTMNCFYLSRDFQLYLNNFGVELNSMPAVFTQTVEKRYL